MGVFHAVGQCVQPHEAAKGIQNCKELCLARYDGKKAGRLEREPGSHMPPKERIGFYLVGDAG